MITKNSALFIKMTKIATKTDKLLSMRQKLSVNDKITMTKTQLGDSPTLKTAKTLINVLSSITYSVCLTHHNAHIFCVQNFQADAWFTSKLVSVSIPGRTPMTSVSIPAGLMKNLRCLHRPQTNLYCTADTISRVKYAKRVTQMKSLPDRASTAGCRGDRDSVAS